ncbi:MAG TPA: gfo/Idh/MocA family oxidoreductase, partial [Bacteroidales bacterium]
MEKSNRRSFVKKMTAMGIASASLIGANAIAANASTPEPAQEKKKNAKKNDGKYRFGFIGTGSRCQEHINNVLSFDDTVIVAICDTQQGPIQNTLAHIANKSKQDAPKAYTGSDRAFEQMLNNEEF